jgi:hypothetical protein
LPVSCSHPHPVVVVIVTVIQAEYSDIVPQPPQADPLYLRFPTSPSPSVLRHVHYTLITGRMTNNRSSRPRDNRSRSPPGPPPPASPLPPTRGATVSLPFSPLQPTAARLTRVRDPTVPLLPPFREAFPATSPLNDPDAGEDDSRPPGMPSSSPFHNPSAQDRDRDLSPVETSSTLVASSSPVEDSGAQDQPANGKGGSILLCLRPRPPPGSGGTQPPTC